MNLKILSFVLVLIGVTGMICCGIYMLFPEINWNTNLGHVNVELNESENKGIELVSANTTNLNFYAIYNTTAFNETVSGSMSHFGANQTHFWETRDEIKSTKLKIEIKSLEYFINENQKHIKFSISDDLIIDRDFLSRKYPKGIQYHKLNETHYFTEYEDYEYETYKFTYEFIPDNTTELVSKELVE